MSCLSLIGNKIPLIRGSKKYIQTTIGTEIHMFQTILSLGAQTVPDATLATEMHVFETVLPSRVQKVTVTELA